MATLNIFTKSGTLLKSIAESLAVNTHEIDYLGNGIIIGRTRTTQYSYLAYDHNKFEIVKSINPARPPRGIAIPHRLSTGKEPGNFHGDTVLVLTQNSEGA